MFVRPCYDKLSFYEDLRTKDETTFPVTKSGEARGKSDVHSLRSFSRPPNLTKTRFYILFVGGRGRPILGTSRLGTTRGCECCSCFGENSGFISRKMILLRYVLVYSITSMLHYIQNCRVLTTHRMYT